MTDNHMQSFLPHSSLSEVIWENGRLRQNVRDHLLKIGYEFYQFLKIPLDIDDIILTGSMSNYNYSEFSDIDLHLLLDFSLVDENIDLVREFMNAKKTVWNDHHEIFIKSHEVELYAQDTHEPHHATGVYSVMNDCWLRKPKPDGSDIDMKSAANKATVLMRQIDDIITFPNRLARIKSFKEKLRKMRQCGLDQGGEYSIENLAFKILRRNGYLEKLSAIQKKDYDEQLSLESNDRK